MCARACRVAVYSLVYWHTSATRSPSSFTRPAAQRPVLDSDWLDGCAASANEVTAVICGYLDVCGKKDKEGEQRKKEKGERQRERQRQRERGRETEGEREREERLHHTSERINPVFIGLLSVLSLCLFFPRSLASSPSLSWLKKRRGGLQPCSGHSQRGGGVSDVSAAVELQLPVLDDGTHDEDSSALN